MKKNILFIFYTPFIFSFDEALRPFLPYPSHYEGSERSQEITEKFNAYLTAAMKLRAFEIENDEEINAIVLTDTDKEKSYGSAVFFFITKPCYVHLCKLKVTKSLRGQGLGSALLHYIMHKKYPSDPEYIKLEVSPSDYTGTREEARTRLIKFYGKHGELIKKTGSNEIKIILKQPDEPAKAF